MARSITDRNLLVWDVFATTGKHGFDENPNVIFRCTTIPEQRPRSAPMTGNEAEAQAHVLNATDAELVRMLEESDELQ